MLEIRAYVTSLEQAQDYLAKIGSSQLSEYAFQDYTYHPKEQAYDLNLEFVRLRVYRKTNWDQKMVELVHKIKTKQGVTGEARIKKQFDKPAEAIVV
jgi:L-lactate utilization protein LutC